MCDVELKLLTTENATAEYVEWLNNKEINQYLESRYSKHSIATVSQYIMEIKESEDVYLFGIFSKENGIHIGNIKLGPVNSIYGRAEIGLLIGDRSYWGKGLGAQAIGIICDYAKNDLGLHKVEAGCYAENIGSLKAFEKAGFIVEGRLKDHFKMGNQWCDAYRLGKVLIT